MLAVIPNTVLLACAEVLIGSAVRADIVVFKTLGRGGGGGHPGPEKQGTSIASRTEV